jgi:ligand-binding sensor domain-containing protein
VRAITSSREGYLWIGTAGGIARFDGSRFELLQREGTAAPPHAAVEALFEDSAGRLWAAFTGGVLLFWEDGAFHAVSAPAPTGGSEISAIAEDVRGTVWFLWRSGELERFDAQSGACVREAHQFRADVAGSLALDASTGKLWIAAGGDLHSIGPEGVRAGPELPAQPVRIAAHPHGGLAIAAGPNVMRMEPGGGEVRTVARGPWTGHEMERVYADRDGTIWVATAREGLFRTRDGKIVRQETEARRLQAMAVDREGQLWAGAENGLYRLRPRTNSVVNTSTGLPTPAVQSVAEDALGRLWLLSQDWQLRVWDGTNLQPVNVPANERAFRTIGVDGDGYVWIGTWGDGVLRIRAERPEEVHRVAELQGWDVSAAHPLADGTLLIGAAQGLARVRGAQCTVLKGAEGEPLRQIRAVAPGAGETLWIGTLDGELLRMSPRGVQRFTSGDGLPSYRIRCLLETGDGSLWIGTAGGGLVRWKEGRFARVTVEHGLPSDSISQILQGPGGEFLVRVCSRDFSSGSGGAGGMYERQRGARPCRSLCS